MKDAHNPSEEEIFAEALRLPTPDGRAAYLKLACGNDEALRRRIEALLHDHDNAGEFLDHPPAAVAASTVAVITGMVPLTEKPGDRIGRYKLLEQIGEGGCGIVYVAEQEQPVRRRVALKVIKLGMDTRQVIARFEAERQALALMDHSNIAKVLDGGATETGRPFFVMELVKGVRITDYCDKNNLSTSERLGFFIQVCHAIQHAHQKGIIHRDIKPSNILVTLHDGMPVPKVIDFGIAKATADQRLTDKTLYTAIEQFIGTPAYMSPEQAELSGLDIDTRSDIYALGVLLYELLSGKTPFDAQRLVAAGLDEIRRIIREEDPPRPSTRISTLDAAEQTVIAKRRHAELPKLMGLIRGDLDWIVMKCLEKDRTGRYETASGLASDVQRHLDNEPVLAGPPTVAYRLRKLIGKHRAVVSVSAAFLLLLTLATAVSMRLAVTANRDRAGAVRAEVIAREARKEAEQSTEAAQTAAHAERLARNLADQQAYRASVIATAAALKNRQPTEASEQLLSAPAALRGWEWKVLMNRVHQGRSILTLNTNSLGADPLARYIAVADGIDLVLVPRAESEPRIRLAGQLGGTVSKIAFSGDGSRLVKVAAGRGQKVQLWTLPHGALACDLNQPEIGQGQALALDNRGTLMAIGCEDQTVVIYDTATGQVVSRVPKQTWNIWTLIFQPGTAILFVGEQGSVPVVWDASAGAVRATFDSIRGVRAAAFSRDGTRLAIADLENVLWVFATKDWSYIKRVPLGLRAASAVAIDAASDVAIVGDFDGALQFVSLEKELLMPPLVAHDAPVTFLSIIDDHAISTGADASMSEWNVASGIEDTLGHNPEGALAAISLSERFALLASVSWDGTIRVWSLATKRNYVLQQGGGNWDSSIAFAEDGSLLASITHGVLRLWNPLAGTLVAEVPRAPLSHLCLGASVGNPEVLSADADGLFSCDRTGTPRPIAVPGLKNVRLLYRAPGSSLLAVGTSESLCLIDWATRTLKTSFGGYTDDILAASSDAGGTIWATFQAGGRLRIWHSPAATPLIERLIPPWKMDSFRPVLAVSGDGARLFVGGSGLLDVIDAASGNSLVSLDVEQPAVLQWSDAYQGLIAASESGRFTIMSGLDPEEYKALATRNKGLARASLQIARNALDTALGDKKAAAQWISEKKGLADALRAASVVEVLRASPGHLADKSSNLLPATATVSAASLRVHVVSANGTPLQGAKCTLLLGGYPLGNDGLPQSPTKENTMEKSTDTNGIVIFQHPGLTTPQTHILHLQCAGYSEANRFLRGPIQQMQELTIALFKVRSVTLQYAYQTNATLNLASDGLVEGRVRLYPKEGGSYRPPSRAFFSFVQNKRVGSSAVLDTGIVIDLKDGQLFFGESNGRFDHYTDLGAVVFDQVTTVDTNKLERRREDTPLKQGHTYIYESNTYPPSNRTKFTGFDVHYAKIFVERIEDADKQSSLTFEPKVVDTGYSLRVLYAPGAADLDGAQAITMYWNAYKEPGVSALPSANLITEFPSEPRGITSGTFALGQKKCTSMRMQSQPSGCWMSELTLPGDARILALLFVDDLGRTSERGIDLVDLVPGDGKNLLVKRRATTDVPTEAE